MKFSCLQDNLKQGLSIVSHLTAKNVNFPILNNVLVKIDEKVIKFITTNLEVAINVGVRGKVDMAGEFTVPARLFYDYIALLPNDRVDMEVKENSIHIQSGAYDTKIKGQISGDFPLLPTINREKSYFIRGKDFKRALEQVIFAVSSNEIRPEISGVYFSFNSGRPGEILLVGTDSYRLAERKISLLPADIRQSSELKKDIIVPFKTLTEVNHILSVLGTLGDDILEISVADNQVLFAYDAVELIGRLIEGQYPNYRQIIPDNFQTKAIIYRDEFLKTIKSASLFATGLNDISIRINVLSGDVKISSLNSQTGEQMAALKAGIEGRDNEVTLNYKYILDFLNCINENEIEFKMIDANNPCLLVPKDNKDYLYIAMPIRR